MTPLYKITYKYQGVERVMFVKDESKQITGSVKYRPAKYMIDMAYNLKIIDQTTPVIEVTSGNMGIALAKVCKDRGNKLTIYMPKNMSKERMKMIRDLRAELILTNDFNEAFELADKAEGFKVKQFENQYNADSYVALCQELEMKLKEFKAIVAGVGTSGTLSGVGSYLKRKYQSKVIAVEPKESLILSTGENHGEHEIQGLSDGFIPKLYKKELVDQIISVSSNDSIAMSQTLMKKFNLEIGISSGANFLAAVLSEINKAITVFPDKSNRYYSTRLFTENVNSDLVNQIELINLEIL